MFDDLLGPEELVNHLKAANLLSERLKDLYTAFLNPYGGEILRAFNLDVHFDEGEGNWLFYSDEKGERRKVLDLYGDAGKNLLGHRNLDINQEVFEALTGKVPLLTSGSLRKSATILAKNLNDLLADETHHPHWISSFFSSAQESLKEVCEHVMARHHEKQQIFQINLQEMYNQLYLNASAIKLDKKTIETFLVSEKERKLLERAATTLEIIDCLKKINEGRLKRRPYILSNRTIRGATNFLAFSQNQQLLDLDQYRDTLLFIDHDLKVSTKKFSLVAGVIVSIYSSEGEIVDKEILSKLRRKADEENFLLVFEEHLSGIYRTGEDFLGSSQFSIVPDIFCYGEALGAGIINLGVISIRSDKYSPTYAKNLAGTLENELASKVALKTLKIAEQQSLRNQDEADYFKKVLLHLQNEFPEFISEIKGNGFLGILTFSEALRDLCFEYKIFDDAHYLGKFMMSALLRNENLRVFDFDRKGRTLILTPSLFLSRDECDFLYQSLRRLFTSIKEMNMGYFFSHVYPGEKIGPATLIPKQSIHYGKSKKPLSVFLCHLINTQHVSMLVQSHKYLSKDIFKKKIAKITPMLKFDIFFRGDIKDENGIEREVILMALPTTSEEIIKILKSPNSLSLVLKAQEAIAYAKSLGATTIGLGQFTSIMTKNGLLLDPMGMKLTTGNAYTTALSLEALMRKAKASQINVEEACVACVGAAGNIVSVAASLVVDHCASLILIYHSSLNESEKLQDSILGLIKEIENADTTSSFLKTMKSVLKKHPVKSRKDLLDFIELAEVKKVFTVTSDLNLLKKADLVVAGASSTEPFIFADHLKANAVVIDIGVPNNVDPSISKTRPDIKLILGGIALLPQISGEEQAIVTPAFPLPKGESFACLAETIIMSFLPEDRLMHIGPLNKSQIHFIHEKAKKLGFKLGQDKTKNSL